LLRCATELLVKHNNEEEEEEDDDDDDDFWTFHQFVCQPLCYVHKYSVNSVTLSACLV